MDDATPTEVLIGVFLCLGVVGGAAYGWLAVSTVWAVLGGAAVIGVLGLLVVSLIAMAVEGISRLFRRR